MPIWAKRALGLVGALLVVGVFGFAALWAALGGPNGLVCNKYDDNWIVGRPIAEVEARYGQAERFGNRTYRYFLYEDNADIMPSHLDIYYAMEVDDSGVVVSINDHHCPGA